MDTFSESGLNEDILISIEKLGFVKPTPIQAKTIPLLLNSDSDLIAIAQTGTGKTAAFGLPAIQLTNLKDRNSQTLILCPTRELCIQITNDLTAFAGSIKGLNILAVYGGARIDGQIKELKKGAQIVVGTPGRVQDLIRRKKLKLNFINRVVLDEADEMLSMGFKEELDGILAETPKEKQTLLFSATMPKEIINITKKYMNEPKEISVARVNKGADNVKHIYYMVQAKDRYEVLKRIADINPDIYGIVFCRTRQETKDVANKLMQDHYNAEALHGDLSQAQRDEVMGRFRNRQLHLLVATDVAARGIDVNDLTHIINYNLPDESEIYTHRSGRTGRAGKSGTSIAVIHSRETRKLKLIEKNSGITFTKEDVPTGKDICQKQLYALIDKIEKVEVDESQIDPFLPAILEKLDWLSREELIKHFVSAEFNRFLTYYKDAKDVNISDSGEERRRKGKKEKGRNRENNVSLSNIFINIGSKHQLNPTRLITMINDGLRSGNSEIGHIDIKRNFSFFEIDGTKKEQLIKSLNGKIIEGVTLMLEESQGKSSGPISDNKIMSRKRNSKDRNRNRNWDKKKRNKSRKS